MQTMTEPAGTTESRRDLAIKRLKAKNDFKIHLVVYLTVNAMLILIWAMTSSGYFWPIWPVAGWGIGVVMHGYTVYWGSVFTEEQIEREMKSLP